MRNSILLLLALILTVTMCAEKKDKYQDWKTGKVTNLKSQDMQSSSYASQNSQDMTGRGALSPGAGNSGSAGGSFSNAPAHFIGYNVEFETEESAYLLTLSREISLRQPSLLAGGDYKFKQQGPKFVEIVDSAGKKFEFTIVKITKRGAETQAQPR